MKLHKDGTVEGTPEEIAEYNRLTEETDATPETLNNALVGALNTLNRRAIEAPSKQVRDTIISEADKVRNLIQLQKEYWKNRNPEERPKAMYGEKYGENLSKSLEEMEKRTGFPKSAILLYAIKGTNLE